MRIGLTQRIVTAPNYDEARDALAQDWARFLETALPGAAWIALPNIGPDIVEYAARWGLEGFVLTGGETPGSAPRRDATERALIDHARTRGLPLLGVCRGLQMLAVQDGGALIECRADQHVATRHRLRPVSGGLALPDEVNSYHGVAVSRSLPAGWEILAETDDEDAVIEACSLDAGRSLAVMWHPERETSPHPLDVALFRRMFAGGAPE